MSGEEKKEEGLIQDELDQMIKALGEPERALPEPEPESKTEERQIEEPEVKVEESEKEDELEPEPASEPDEKDKIIADLRLKLAEQPIKKEEVKEEPKKEVKEPEVKEPEVTDQDFLGETDLDDLTRDSGEFNKVLNKIYKKAVVDVHKMVTDNVTRSIPDMVRQNVEVINALADMSKKFFDDNPDLVPFKKVVAVVFDDVAKAKPSSTYADVMTEVATETRKRLELPKVAEKAAKEDKQPAPPKLPGKAARAGKIKEDKQFDPLQAELAEMDKALGR